MRTFIERLFIRLVLSLPLSLRRRILGSGPPERRGETLHPDFATLLGLQRVLGIKQFDEIGKSAGISAARQEYQHVFRLGAPKVKDVAITKTSISVADTSIAAHLHTPKNSTPGSPVMIYFHGGGFVLGTLHAYDPLVSFIAHSSGIRVLSVDYRLAPENPFPTGLQDCCAAIKHVSELGIDGIPVSKLIIGGDSAGAALAVEAAHRTVEEFPQVSGLWLFNPGVHVRGIYPSDEEFGEGYGFTREMREWFETLYSGTTLPSDEPAISPLFLDDLGRLPRTWISVGGCDQLRDQIALFAEKLREASVDVAFSIEPGFIHNYLSFSGLVPDARRATERACVWLQESGQES